MSNSKFLPNQYVNEINRQVDLNERNLYENNIYYNNFGPQGGTPLTDNMGRVIANRRTMINNNNYDDIRTNYNNTPQNIMNYNNPPQEQMPSQYQDYYMQNNQQMQSPMQNYPPQYQHMTPLAYQTQFNQNMNMNYYNENNQQNLMNNTMGQMNHYRNEGNYGNNGRLIMNITTQSNGRNYPRSAIRQQNYGNNQIDNYEQGNIILDNRTNERRETEKKILRKEWGAQIEEKRRRIEEAKRKKMEEDKIEEDKYNKYLEEEKEKERIEREKKEAENKPLRYKNNLIQSPLTQIELNTDKKAIPLIPNNEFLTNNNNSINDFNDKHNQIKTPPKNQYQQMLEMNYTDLSKTLDTKINNQIDNLRNEVNSQYNEMTNLFNKLKNDVIEANKLKYEAERELIKIRDELTRQKMEKIVYENKLNQVLERNAPYNNLHIPIKEVDPMYDIHKAQENKTLHYTSSMVYANDMINEKNVSKVKQLSALAQVGQSLVGESEFVPIPINPMNNGKNNNYRMEIENSKDFGDVKLDREDDTKIIDDYMKKGDYQNMYTRLCKIADINHKGNMLKENNGTDYQATHGKRSQREELEQLDTMLNNLIGKDKIH